MNEIPKLAGIFVGVSTAWFLWYRITVTLGTSFVLDVSAVLIIGVLVISAFVGYVTFGLIGGELPE